MRRRLENGLIFIRKVIPQSNAPDLQAEVRPPAIEFHIFGTTSSRRDPNLLESSTNASTDPRRVIRDLDVSLLSAVGAFSFFALSANLAAALDPWNERMPSRIVVV